MPSGQPNRTEQPRGGVLFATTHWSVVLAAGRTESAEAHDALEQLCCAYWYPLYAFVRRQGHGPHDAQDLTQEFFARLLAKNYLSTARPERGRFRWFLLAALRHFLANEWDKSQAAKRGGGQRLVPLDELLAEQNYSAEPADRLTAEKLYERAWALTVLQQVRTRLRAEFVAAGRGARFDLLEKFLPGEDSEMTYAQAGQMLGLAEGTVKADVHRLKNRYRELLRAEIAQTVESPAGIDEELRSLITALAD
jgi:RNA polymerase sigma-70 factor (ECF subfamily)